MKNDVIIYKMDVDNQVVRVKHVQGVDYISLTDMAVRANAKDPNFAVSHWMSTAEAFGYIGFWEELNNPDFESDKYHFAKAELIGSSTFMITPTIWRREYGGIGVVPGDKTGLGALAHPDIAFKFATSISTEFELYLIRELQRLKSSEAYQYNAEWRANRLLAKANYVIHTDAIKNHIVPDLTEKQRQFAYAQEADVLNVALFGMTAKEWREKNPELAKESNLRDEADLLELIVLNNLENLNAAFIKQDMSQGERLVRLNEAAREQLEVLAKNRNLDELKRMQKEQIEKRKNNPLMLN